jgi:hypothetical protein
MSVVILFLKPFNHIVIHLFYSLNKKIEHRCEQDQFC